MSGAALIRRLAGGQIGTAFTTLPTRRLSERIELVAHDGITTLGEIWKKLEAEGNASVYQRYDWIYTCLETIDRKDKVQPYIVVGYHEGEVAFIFPLVIEGRYIKRLKWIGGSHSNYNMPIFSNYFLNNFSSRDINVIFRRIIAMAPGVSLVKLCNQPVEWQGNKNPFLQIPHSSSTNPAFEMSLEGGLEGVLQRTNKKRKNKKFRSQERFCQAHGGYRVIMPQNESDALHLMQIFKEQKAHRFKMLGIRNVFGSPEAEAFLDHLARASVTGDNPVLRLYALEVGGSVRAIYGGGISGKRFSGYFSSISDDEFTQISPGEMLLYLLVDDCARRGFEHIDLGAGDERYKRSWCSQHIQLFDIIVAARWQAKPIVWFGALKGVTKRQLRANATLWDLLKRLRRLKGSVAINLERAQKEE